MTEMPATSAQPKRRNAQSDLLEDATRDISVALNDLLADVFALYLKTKNFHWHISAPWTGSRSV